jgi:hypothetical protein
MAAKATRKTYYPAKTFDDDLERLANLFREKNWSFSNIDNAQLLKDALEQRNERLAHDRLESQYFAAHETLGLNQEARHERFSAALNAARGAFRNDKSAIAELDAVKRSVRKAAAKKATTEK